MTPELINDKLIFVAGKVLALTLKKIADKTCKLDKKDDDLFFTEKEMSNFRCLMIWYEKALKNKNPLNLNDKQKSELKNIYLDIAQYISMIAIHNEVIKNGTLCR